MRILIAIDEFSLTAEGGSNTVVGRLVKALAKSHHVAILNTHRQGRDVKKAVGNVTHYSLKVNYPPRFRAWLSLYNPRVSPRIDKVLADFRPDVVHAHTIHMYLTYDLLRLAKHYTDKVFFTGHDVMPVFYSRLTQFSDTDRDGIPDFQDLKVHFWRQWWQNKLHFFPLRNWIIRHYVNQTTVITVSRALQAVYETNGIKVTKVIHNGINLSDWKASPEKVRRFKKQYRIEEKKVLFLGGRIREDKGAFQAVKLLAKLGDKWILLVAGRKTSVSPMVNLADTLQVKKRIIPLGFLAQEQLKIAYFASDIILVPSICFDSFPNAVIEGMASQKVVLATCFGGAKEAIEDGRTGFLINPFDILGSVNKIDHILKHPKDYQRIAQAALAKVKKEFTSQIQVKQYLQMYRK